MAFFIAASNQTFQEYPKWVWNYDGSGPSVDFIEMMKYTLMDFHLNCCPPFKSVNDERTPFVEPIVPPFKAFGKVLQPLEFTW